LLINVNYTKLHSQPRVAGCTSEC